MSTSCYFLYNACLLVLQNINEMYVLCKYFLYILLVSIQNKWKMIINKVKYVQTLKNLIN
jgi:hypothetical protein